MVAYNSYYILFVCELWDYSKCHYVHFISEYTRHAHPVLIRIQAQTMRSRWEVALLKSRHQKDLGTPVRHDSNILWFIMACHHRHSFVSYKFCAVLWRVLLLWILMYYVDFAGYEEINESNMDPSLAQHSSKLNTPSLDAPTLPCRGKQKRPITLNRNTIATTGPSIFKGVMESDTDSDYEYVSKSVKKNNKSSIRSCKSMITIGKVHTCHAISIWIDVWSWSLKDKLIRCQGRAFNMTKRSAE